VWIFGHGIFASPSVYYDDEADEGGVIAMANEVGAIVLATAWRGLTTSDIGVPVSVAGDFGRFPELTDKLAQGLANTVALARLAEDGAIFDDPIFAGKADPSTLRYLGISLGGIEGAVLFAVDDTLPHGVFHVGGSTWSTMLERSVNWVLFEDTLVASGLSDPADRQLLYSVSQLFWDPVDPALYAADLTDRSVLWQTAIGDDQVSNLTSYTLARSVGAPLVAPAPEVPGLEVVAPGDVAPAMAVHDPELGSSEGTNRPAEDTVSHEIGRTWPGIQAQITTFLDADAPGRVVHPCGEGMCRPGATGE
jgi:hypothetical protein